MKWYTLSIIKNWKAGWAVFLITSKHGTRNAKLIYPSKKYFARENA